MAAEPKNLHMLMDADARLAAAAGGAARFLADNAGLEAEAGTRLQSAVIAACKEAFRHLGLKHPHLGVDFTRYSDRIEVSLSREDDGTPAAGPGSSMRLARQKVESKGNSGTLSGVDRVQYETHGNEIVTRLTKYLGKVAPKV